MTIPKILILSGSCDTSFIASIHKICANLSSEFGLIDVVVRSADLPIDRLLDGSSSSHGSNNGSAGSSIDRRGDCPTLWVYVGYASHKNSSFSRLESEVPIPILKIIVDEDNDNDEKEENITLQIAKFCSLSSPSVKRMVRNAVQKKRQSRLVNDAQLHTKSPKYVNTISKCYDEKTPITGNNVINKNIPLRKVGKVRDIYAGGKKIALVTTDRQSGFDRQLAMIPYKGAVLNLTSAFWFDQTKHIIRNHLISVPHPYVSIVKKCKPFPIEFVVRSYVTGSTSTSIWKNYQNGVRNYCGHILPEGLTKNEKLWSNLLTPTTKEEEHDRPISPAEIIEEGWMNQEDWDVCSEAALRIFALGQEIAAKHGLILVDTKYEFGRDESTGQILLIDEVHTPDSSRYWLASTYEERIAEGKEPDNIDKEFLRLWFKDQCDPYTAETLPEPPKDLVCELSRRYITLYEMITWKDFDFELGGGESAIAEAIESSGITAPVPSLEKAELEPAHQVV